MQGKSVDLGGRRSIKKKKKKRREGEKNNTQKTWRKRIRTRDKDIARRSNQNYTIEDEHLLK